MNNKEFHEFLHNGECTEGADFKNRLLSMSKFQRTITPPFPDNMLVELTNACNHRCMFCTNHKMTRPISWIDKSLLYRLLEEAYSLGTREVGFYTTGEPLLSKDLYLYVEKAKNIGFDYVFIATNGALARPDRIKPVIDAGLDSIKFSINAGTSSTYKTIHGKNDFDLVINNLKWISNYRTKIDHPLKLYVSYVITKQNQHELSLLKNIISPYIDYMHADQVGNQAYMIGNTKKSSVKIPCSMLFNRVHITCEGYLTICCTDFQNYLVVADLNKSSLEDSWNNELFVEMRRRHLNNDVKGTLCYRCAYNKKTKIEPLFPQAATLMTD